jgi:hypothetical protein
VSGYDDFDAATRARIQAAIDEGQQRAPVFPLPQDGPLVEAHALVDELVREWVAIPFGRPKQWEQLEAGRRILQASPAERVPLMHACLERAVWGAKQPGDIMLRLGTPDHIPGKVAGVLLQGDLPLRTEDRVRIAEMLPAPTMSVMTYLIPVEEAASRIAEGFAEPGAGAVLRDPALRARKLLVWLAHYEVHWRPLLKQFEDALTGGAESILDPFEPWAAQAIGELEAMESAERERWRALLEHFSSLQSPKPSGKWMKTARALVAGMGEEAFRTRVHGWIATARAGTDEVMTPRNSDAMRAAAWCLADLGGDGDAESVGALALLSGVKIPGLGQRAEKVTNACIAALGEMGSDAAMAQLTRIRAKGKYPRVQALVEKMLEAVAARRGLTPGEIEELAAPTFGMDEPGLLRETLDGWTFELRVTGTTTTESGWISPEGKRQKSPPAALKEDFADELKALKAAPKSIEEALAAQRARLERLPLEERAIPFAAWRERYRDHPLLAEMARRLIWRFETGDEAVTGAWLGGTLVGADDRPLDGVGEETRVRSWHPIAADAEEIAAWRAWLDRHGVTQPFKQAHREVYRLTDAERDTAVYSNRFAGHVLRQHQMAAVAQSRGWRYQLQGDYDRWLPVSLRLSGLGLHVEYWVDAIREGEASSQSGVSLYVSTDQVRFVDASREPVPLETIAPLLFSEVMRDVDLFVAVSSVGTDPTWVDGGPIRGFGAYWTEFAFGALSATAVTRREVLERLLPRLRIASACTLEDRFLTVRGSLRTYRIHLGSGNVMMEPGSEYLCIVPDRREAARGKTDALPLPFEGDAMLTLILSKAFLLADDTRITDRLIVTQIRRGMAAG